MPRPECTGLWVEVGGDLRGRGLRHPQLLETANAPVASREILEATKAKMGMVLNMYAVMANVPGALATYTFGYGEFRRDSGFDAAEQEVVLLTISRFNDCAYCVAAHSVVADSNKVDPAVADAVRDGKPVPDAKLQTLGEFTPSLLTTRGRPATEDLLAAGYTESRCCRSCWRSRSRRSATTPTTSSTPHWTRPFSAGPGPLRRRDRRPARARGIRPRAGRGRCERGLTQAVREGRTAPRDSRDGQASRGAPMVQGPADAYRGPGESERPGSRAAPK